MFPHYSPITNTGDTNLLPSVYTSLVKLGFSELRIKVLIENYVAQCAIKDLNSVYFIANDFETHYMKRLDFFNKQAENKSVGEVVGNYLKDKRRSLSSANFLALNRLGAAVLEGKPERIIHALTYYDCVTTELKISGTPIALSDARKRFIALMQHRRLITGLSRAVDTAEKIRIIIQHQDSLLGLTEIGDIAQTEYTMLETFAEWYLMTEDVHVLHVLLGFYGLLSIKDYLEEYPEWLREFWLHAQVYSLMTKKSLLWKKVDIVVWEDLLNGIYQIDDFIKIMLFGAVYDLNQTYKLEFLRRIAQTIIES